MDTTFKLEGIPQHSNVISCSRLIAQLNLKIKINVLYQMIFAFDRSDMEINYQNRYRSKLMF